MLFCSAYCEHSPRAREANAFDANWRHSGERLSKPARLYRQCLFWTVLANSAPHARGDF